MEQRIVAIVECLIIGIKRLGEGIRTKNCMAICKLYANVRPADINGTHIECYAHASSLLGSRTARPFGWKVLSTASGPQNAEQNSVL